MIEVCDLVKSFDGTRALDGLSLTVPQGAVYGLVGPNGAGKSTLMGIMTTNLKATSGELLLDGREIRTMM